MNIRTLFLSLIAWTLLTAGCGDSDPDFSEFYKGPETEEPGTPDEPIDPDATQMTVKAMSFNIRYANNNNPELDGDNRWDYRKVAFGPMIDEQQPTVIGVQEARPIQLSYLETAWPDYKWLGVGRCNDNAVYYNDTTNGNLVKLDAGSGEQLVSLHLADKLDSSPTIAPNGVIYCNGMLNNQPTLFAVDATATAPADSWSQMAGNPSKTACRY